MMAFCVIKKRAGPGYHVVCCTDESPDSTDSMTFGMVDRVSKPVAILDAVQATTKTPGDTAIFVEMPTGLERDMVTEAGATMLGEMPNGAKLYAEIAGVQDD